MHLMHIGIISFDDEGILNDRVLEASSWLVGTIGMVRHYVIVDMNL